MKSRRTAGILLSLGSSVFFALSNTLAGVAYRGGSNPFTLSSTRFVLPAILLFLILRWVGMPIRLGARAGLIATGIGLLSAVYTFALLLAIERLPVSIAILLFYLFPILTAFILAAIGGAPLTARMTIGALTAFCGLGIALGVQLTEFDSVGLIAGLVSAIGFAVVCSISNALMLGHDSRPVTLYLSVAATLSILALSVFIGGIVLPVTAGGWAGFVLSNVLFAVAVIGFYASISMAGAGPATFFLNLEPIVVVGAGYVLLDQLVSLWQMLGITIVVVALIYASRAPQDGARAAPT